MFYFWHCNVRLHDDGPSLSSVLSLGGTSDITDGVCQKEIPTAQRLSSTFGRLGFLQAGERTDNLVSRKDSAQTSQPTESFVKNKVLLLRQKAKSPCFAQCVGHETHQK